ncbi:MAG TPA: HK97 family phage prohead protease [Solirubrobacterales bacterium]|nr:HK97 family phage prohead protease [Solirubrobacterales bacterium]
MGKQAQPNLADLAEPVVLQTGTLRGTVLETRDADFKIFTKGMEIEKSATSGDGKTRIKCIASSSIVDRHGDTITEECIRGMAKQAVGLTIFRNHTYSVPDDVFGFVESAKTRKMTVAEAKDKGLIPDHIASTGTRDEVAFLELGIVVDDSNEKSNQTIASLENGVTLGISIGAMILDYEEADTETDSWFPPLIINQVDLMEASVVGIPANPLSWVEGATKAIAIQKGLIGERSTREDLYKAIARQKDEEKPSGAKDDNKAETVDPDNVPAGEDMPDAEEEGADEVGEDTPAAADKAAEPVEPNHTQDDPAAIVNYWRHVIHDGPSDEEEPVEPPTPGELKVLVRDALLAYKNAYPSDEEMDEVMDAINEDRPLEADTDPNADADSTEESDADTDAQEAPEGSDPETAEGTDSGTEKQAKAELQKLVDAGAVSTLKDATELLGQTLSQLIEVTLRAEALEAENAEFRSRLLTADERISEAVAFVNKVMDLPLIRKSAVRAEGTTLSSRLHETYGDVLNLTGKGSS